jgi:hypothetical protein
MITGLQNTKDVKFIRAVWGDFNFSNIPATPIFNELVYVWGIENRNKLKELGYDTQLVSVDKMSIYYSTYETTYFHKLLALEIACDTFDKIIMIDWDYNLVKNLDDKFFNYLNTKEFLAPIYSYDLERVLEYTKYPSYWNEYESNNLHNYSWRLNDLYVIPNACIIYTSNKNIGKTLLDIATKKQIKTLVEEFTIQIHSNCDLDEYIENYHPTFMYGRTSNYYKSINDYIDTKLNMDVYFEQK